MKSKKEFIKEILDSGAKYAKTTVSPEACEVEIVIRDIENLDYLPDDFEWCECSTGLDECDY